MNIYLTSYGLDTRYKDYMSSYNEIIEVLKNKKVAIIPNAKLINQDRTNSIIAKEELNKNNIEAIIVDLDKDELKFANYDALYLSGGEPKNLMDSINNAKLFKKIEDFIDKGGIIIGQSAGAMIFSKKYLDTTTDELLVQENGFDYVCKLIVPHYDNLPEEILKHIPKDVFKIKDNDNLIKLNKNKFMKEKEFKKDVIRAHACCSRNRKELEKVNVCGCFYCLKIFDPKLITEWCDNEETAICPFCGIDSIIYENKFYPVNKDFLEAMNHEWF